MLLKKLNFHDRNERLKAFAVKEKVEKVLAAIEKMFNAKIVVENMKNQFAETYVINDLPEPERETVEVDLEKQMDADCAFYRSRGLNHWADEILKSKNGLKRMNAETKQRIAREMQDGAAVIFMPGKKSQYNSFSAALEVALVPQSDEANLGFPAAGQINDDFTRVMYKSEKNKTDDIPLHPYLLIVYLTGSPGLFSSHVPEIIEKMKKIKVEREKEKRLPVYPIMPMECASFQSVFIDRASRLRTKNGKKIFSKFKRNDRVYFISLAGFFDRFGLIPAIVPWVRWNHHRNRLVYEVVNPEDVPGASGGIMLVSRVEF